MRRYSGISFRKSALQPLMWILGGLLFAVFTEVVQYPLPYRAFNINDLMANGIGVGMGYLIILVFQKGVRQMQFKCKS